MLPMIFLNSTAEEIEKSIGEEQRSAKLGRLLWEGRRISVLRELSDCDRSDPVEYAQRNVTLLGGRAGVVMRGLLSEIVSNWQGEGLSAIVLGDELRYHVDLVGVVRAGERMQSLFEGLKSAIEEEEKKIYGSIENSSSFSSEDLEEGENQLRFIRFRNRKVSPLTSIPEEATARTFSPVVGKNKEEANKKREKIEERVEAMDPSLNPSEALVSFNFLKNITREQIDSPFFRGGPSELIHNFPRDIRCPVRNMLVLKDGRRIHGNIISYFDSRIRKKMEMIATQYPVPESGDFQRGSFGFGGARRVWASADRFWRAVFEKKLKVIVDLTAVKETSAGKSKDGGSKEEYAADGRVGFQRYYPKHREEVLHFDGITIVSQKSDQPLLRFGVKQNLLLRDDKTKQEREVARFHYQFWKDASVINVNDLLQLVKYVRKFSEGSLPIIHCSAGVGRSGTLIVATMLHWLKEQNLLTERNVYKKMQDLILLGRLQRGPLFVQRVEQLEMLFEFVPLLLSRAIP